MQQIDAGARCGLQFVEHAESHLLPAHGKDSRFHRHGASVQAMVFGNMGDNSATGVGFTRNPSTGEKVFYGEFLVNAQGEDVVAGIRTPQPIAELEKVMPEAYKQLRKITSSLEKHYKDVQDFEFTIEEGKLYMLQTRNGKRTGPAAVRMAVDMVGEVD